jgi:hypothetical protein
MYLPDVSFDDAGTDTSSIKFIRQSTALDLGKLDDSYGLYWKVSFFRWLFCWRGSLNMIHQTRVGHPRQVVRL